MNSPEIPPAGARGTGYICSSSMCCPPGDTSCSGKCVDTFNDDPSNCGGCGKTCFGATWCCNATCVDLATNCGACGNVCGPGTTCTFDFNLGTFRCE